MLQHKKYTVSTRFLFLNHFPSTKLHFFFEIVVIVTLYSAIYVIALFKGGGAGRVSSVSIATRYALDGLGQKIFVFSISVQTGPGAHLASCAKGAVTLC